MSKSIHQTKRSVYGGKSKGEIYAMIKGNDLDVEMVARKGLLKKGVIDWRGKPGA